MEAIIGQIAMFRNGVDFENEEEEIIIDEAKLHDLE